MKMMSLSTCVEERQWDDLNRRAWMLKHYKTRLDDLIARKAHVTHPEIVARYERDIAELERGSER